MPLYEYECQNCHRRVEKIQKFSDAPLTVCPHCAGVLERTLTAPAIQFKGSGWYKDLYSSAKPSTPAGDSKPAASGDSSSSSESKPAEAAPAPAPVSSSPAPSSGSNGG